MVGSTALQPDSAHHTSIQYQLRAVAVAGVIANQINESFGYLVGLAEALHRCAGNPPLPNRLGRLVDERRLDAVRADRIGADVLFAVLNRNVLGEPQNAVLGCGIKGKAMLGL